MNQGGLGPDLDLATVKNPSRDTLRAPMRTNNKPRTRRRNANPSTEDLDSVQLGFYLTQLRLEDELGEKQEMMEAVKKEMKLYDKALFKLRNPFCRNKHVVGVDLPEHLGNHERHSMLRSHLQSLRDQKQTLIAENCTLVSQMMKVYEQKIEDQSRRFDPSYAARRALAQHQPDQRVDYEVEEERMSWTLMRVGRAIEKHFEAIIKLREEEGTAAEGSEFPGVKIPTEFATVDEKVEFLRIRHCELKLTEYVMKEKKKALAKLRKEQAVEERLEKDKAKEKERKVLEKVEKTVKRKKKLCACD